MPLTSFQLLILQLIAGLRSEASFVAGGTAINFEGPRMSNDIDIFQDGVEGLSAVAEADAAALVKAGFEVRWIGQRTSSKIGAEVSKGTEATRLDWVVDADFRFFPAIPDKVFGYVLDPVDLATNKVAAAADRREPRDVVDLVTIHETILPLGATITAALGRFPGLSPEGMLEEIRRHSRFTAPEFEALASIEPVDVVELHTRIQKMLEDAEQFIAKLPSDAVGYLFLDDDGKAVQPDVGRLRQYRWRSASRRGQAAVLTAGSQSDADNDVTE